MENGDIVTACLDGVVRVWTAEQERIVDPQELELFASRLSQYKLKRCPTTAATHTHTHSQRGSSKILLFISLFFSLSLAYFDFLRQKHDSEHI